jgi:hypothetical protein
MTGQPVGRPQCALATKAMPFAASRLLSRKRQTIVSLLGITLSVALFLAGQAVKAGASRSPALADEPAGSLDTKAGAI